MFCLIAWTYSSEMGLTLQHWRNFSRMPADIRMTNTCVWVSDGITRAQQLHRRGPKSGAAVPLSVGRGAKSPSNTMSPWPRPTSVPSGILIHPTVWPQYTNVKTGFTNGRPKTNLIHQPLTHSCPHTLTLKTLKENKTFLYVVI